MVVCNKVEFGEQLFIFTALQLDNAKFDRIKKRKIFIHVVIEARSTTL